MKLPPSTSLRAATGRLALSLSFHLRLRSKTSSRISEECRLTGGGPLLVPLRLPEERFFIVDALL